MNFGGKYHTSKSRYPDRPNRTTNLLGIGGSIPYIEASLGKTLNLAGAAGW